MDNLFREHRVGRYCLWYYTPMPMAWTSHLKPTATVYDCMDELSAFKNAPPELKQRERELLDKADLVFTGGHSLFEAKREQHPNVYPFPSSIDVTHFAQARSGSCVPADQASLPHPRLGYCGVIDERMDLKLLATVAALRPDWQFVMVGPVVKIDPATLPKNPNIHFLGMKTYQELPHYMGGWDVAILPFARNESTRFISPTKIPEYLAAGLPVVSTSIRDVVNTYGASEIVHITDEPLPFIDAVKKALQEDAKQRNEKVDVLLSKNSWCRTWGRMAELIDDVVQRRTRLLSAHLPALSHAIQPPRNGPTYLTPE
jgi:UDP-galactopyranose mutase